MLEEIYYGLLKVKSKGYLELHVHVYLYGSLKGYPPNTNYRNASGGKESSMEYYVAELSTLTHFE